MQDFIKRTLSNGINVYMYIDEDMKKFVASYNVFYGTNGYYDKFYYKDKAYSMKPAIAHLLEHYLIEESKLGNMLHRFKEKNYEVNGGTYSELTTYYFLGIKDTKESLKELIHMVDDPDFSEEKLENVKGAIVDEVLKNDDDKYRVGFNINRRNTFKNYECVNETYNTLGSKETTLSITLDDVKVCYNAYYNDENKFLVLAGNFKEEEMLEYLESIYKEIDAHPNLMREFDYGDEFDVRSTYEEVSKPVDEDVTIVTYKFKNNYKESILVIDAYLSLLGAMKFSLDSDFVISLNKDKIITGGVGFSADFFKGVISYTIDADTKNSDEFIKRLDETLKDCTFDEKRFELLKKSMKVMELSKLERKYQSILRFPPTIEFSEKLFRMDKVDGIAFESFKEFVSDLKLDVKTVTVIKKQS